MHQHPPLYLVHVQAGFPSPADDWIEDRLDLNRHLVKRPSSTFFLRVKGDSMVGDGIHEGDILVVDRSIKPLHNHVVIAALNGDLTVKRLSRTGGKIQLLPGNPAYPPIEINPEADFRIWGVVTTCIHPV